MSTTGHLFTQILRVSMLALTALGLSFFCSDPLSAKQATNTRQAGSKPDILIEPGEQANEKLSYDSIIQINHALANKNWREAEILIRNAALREWPEPFQGLLQEHLLTLIELNPTQAAELKNSFAVTLLANTTPNQAKLAAIKLGFVHAEKADGQGPEKEAEEKANFQDDGNASRNQRYRNKKTRGHDLRKLIHLWTISKEKSAKEKAYEIARSASKNSSKSASRNTCNALWAYSQFVLGRKARAEQNRKLFFERQMQLTEQLQNKYCDAQHFLMPEEKFQEFKQSELLWGARLLWENNILNTANLKNTADSTTRGAALGAEELARAVLQYALKESNNELTLEAAQVLYGRILYESSAPKLVASEIEALIAQLVERPTIEKKQNNPDAAKPDSFSELVTYLKFRLALFRYAGAEDAKCAAVLIPMIEEFKTSVDLYDSPGLRKDYAAALYWWARCEYLLGNEKPGPLKRNSKEKLSFAFNEINRYAATSYYAMIFDADFPWVRDSLKSEKVDFVLRQETATDKQLKAIKKLEQFNDIIEASALFPELAANSPLVTEPLKWLSTQLKNNEKQVFLYRKGLMFNLHRIFKSKEFNAELVLSAGRLAKHFRLDGPEGLEILDLLYPKVYREAFEKASEECNIDLPLLYAVSRQESLYDPKAKSPAGARGLLQLMPGVWNAFRISRGDLKLSEDPYHVDSNLLAGACHLHDAVSYFRGNLIFALAGYNAGTSLARSWIERRFKGDERLFAEFIPFAETQDYVKQILRSRFLIQKMNSQNPIHHQ